MKKALIFLTTIGLAGMTLSAFSEDTSWTGVQIGANAGYGWGNPSASDAYSLLPFPSISGATAGGQVGFDWQLGQWIVVGLNYEMAWSDLNGTDNDTLTEGANTITLSASEKVTWFGNLLPRLGFLPTNNLLIYGTGGLAFGHVEGSTNVSLNTSSYPISSFNETVPGWAAGIGLEWMIIPHWSLGAEYLYNQLENIDATASNASTSSSQSSITINSYNVTALSINYRF